MVPRIEQLLFLLLFALVAVILRLLAVAGFFEVQRWTCVVHRVYRSSICLEEAIRLGRTVQFHANQAIFSDPFGGRGRVDPHSSASSPEPARRRPERWLLSHADSNQGQEVFGSNE
ncbi:hypothetical protein MRB53_036965 [Persea americana]|nr:hypothetical protein MRB53_036965 [Persea americana]